MVLVVEGALLLVAWGLGRLMGMSPFAALRLAPSSVAWGLVAALPSMALVPWSLRSRWGPMARLRDRVSGQFRTLFAESTLLDFVLISLAAGLCEEVFFRGLVQQGLEGRFGQWWALLAMSVLFALAHPLSLLYAMLAGLMGLYLGALLLAFGDLTVPVVTHAVHDIVALVALSRHIRRPPQVAGRPGRGRTNATS
jgi:membrane protease YdiL (CAAX protease family)